MNPMQIIQLIKQGRNPQQLVLMMLQQQANTPLGANLLSLAQQGKTAEIEKIARNLCKEKGVDFDQEFNNFRKNIGL